MKWLEIALKLNHLKNVHLIYCGQRAGNATSDFRTHRPTHRAPIRLSYKLNANRVGKHLDKAKPADLAGFESTPLLLWKGVIRMVSITRSYEVYRNNFQIFKVLVWTLVLLNKLMLIWAQIVLMIPG